MSSWEPLDTPNKSIANEPWDFFGKNGNLAPKNLKASCLRQSMLYSKTLLAFRMITPFKPQY